VKEATLQFTCTGIEEGKAIPLAYTGRGQDISPEFVLHNLSPKAKTLAITLEDLTHPIQNFTHWVIWNIPAANRIPPGIPAGKVVWGKARQGIGYGFHHYAGPKPPKGKTHTYRFCVYALDCAIELSANATKRRFLKDATAHIIQSGSVTGTFHS